MNIKKLGLFILLAFGISWLSVLIFKLLDIEYGSLQSTIIIAALFMPGPAIATFIIQKWIYKEGFAAYGWTFDKKAAKWYAGTILVFLSLVLLCFGFVALLGNTQLIPQFGTVDFSQIGFNERFIKMVAEKTDISKIKIPEIASWLFFIIALFQGILAGATVNLPFMFGEEFGWRGLMLRETQSLGFLKSNILIGVIWGLWHLPIILMGHNYPNHPYFGIIMMCFFTTALAPIFAYIRLKTKSILGPCFLHGMINATGALFALYIANANELWSTIAGVAGVLAGIVVIVCIYIFDKKFVEEYASL